MPIHCTQEDRTLTAVISGELDHHAAQHLMTELEQRLDAAFPLRLTQWNNSTIRDVTVTGYSAKARCGLVFEAEQVGMISNVRLNDVELVNLPAGIPMDEFAVKEKGEYLLFAHGAKGLTFENVRIHLPAELASTWKGISEYSSCEDVVIRNCNFS